MSYPYYGNQQQQPGAPPTAGRVGPPGSTFGAGYPAGGPPTSTMGPPPSGFGNPGAPAPSAAKPSVQFFSVAGGTPTPSAPVPSGPPASGFGAMPPPPTGQQWGAQPGVPPLAQPAPSSVPFYPAQGGISQMSPGTPGFGAPSTGGPPGAPPSGPPMGGPPMGGPPMGGPPMGGPPTGAPAMGPPGALGPPSMGAPVTEYPGSQYGAPPQSSMVGMPAAFDSMGNLTQPSHTPGVPAPGMSEHADPQAGGSLPTLQEIDLTIQCDPAFMRSTVSRLHVSQATANTSRIPLGVICKPMAGDEGTANEKIEVVDFGSTGIVRCKRCRTYINPFVSWIENGRKWRCNICGMGNEVPTSYFSHLDANGLRRDRLQRPELSKCSVEFVAPGDYMVRPPQPPVYFFVIDVSSVSVQSGMLQSCVNAIKDSLDRLPGAPRTQIGFITFDTAIHFYNLKSSLASPQMLVVSDVTDVILPLPEDLLVNLQESRQVVESLLDSLPSLFANSSATNTCTGPALLAAKRVIQHVGGKLLLFQSSLPSIGEGTLKPRDNPRLLGSDKEHLMLNAEDAWYKNNAIDFSRLQVAVDTFLFSGQYTDLATMSVLSKYTSGNCYYYPAFHALRDGAKFEKELTRCLTRATGFEAVMRVRATRGIRITNFYGNYFVRGTDLLALPNVTADTTFALDLAYDESMLAAQAITVQAALLYTSSNGERRIRIHTIVLPVTQSLPEVVDSIDIDSMVNILTKQAVDIAQKTGFDNARQRVHQITVEMLRGCRSAPANAGYGMPGQYNQQQEATVPLTLQLLPLYSMSIQKSLALRGGAEVRIDERAYYHQLAGNMDVDESRVFIYPRLFSLHDLAEDVGLPSSSPEDDGLTAGPYRIKLPQILNLTHERLTSDGVYLLENGYDCFMWIGRQANPAVISTLFGYSSLDGVDTSTLQIQPENSEYSSHVNAVIVALRADRARHLQLHYIREGDGHAEAYFARYLIEDRAHFPGGAMSYTEYHGYVARQVSGLPG